MGCRLMLQNDGGTSDRVLTQLRRHGCVWSASMVRSAIDDAVAAIPQGNDVRRNTPKGDIPVCVHTADNSDKRLLRKMVNSIVTATIQVTTLPAALLQSVSSSFRSGFPHFFVGLGGKILPNSGDDEKVREVLDGQNIQALLLSIQSMAGSELLNNART